MNQNKLIIRNVKRNLRHYFLYVFALTFSVALYFIFVTLQYDASMDKVNELVEAATLIQVGSIFLVFIVMIFLMYANHLFLNRRSQELGMYQLIGMTRKHIFRLLVKENIWMFSGSILVGIVIGFSFSKLLVMILFKMIDIETITTLNFSIQALVQTLLVFGGIFLVISIMNHLFLKRHSMLHLFQRMATSENQEQGISIYAIVRGILGIAFIGVGYSLSTKLFSGDFSGNGIFYAMFTIGGLLIVGTYLFFRGSIGIIFQLIRKKKDGHLSVTNVLSLATVLFRIQSSALLLTIITLLSTLAITLTSISYISYHSAAEKVQEMVPHDFSLFTEEEAEQFTDALGEEDISYQIHHTPVTQGYFDIRGALVPGTFDNTDLNDKPELILQVISDASGKLEKDEVMLTKPQDVLGQLLELKDDGMITFLGQHGDRQLNVVATQTESVLPARLSEGFPVVIGHEAMVDHIQTEYNHVTKENEFPLYVGVDIQDQGNIEEANQLFHVFGFDKWRGKWTGFESQLDIRTAQIEGMGLLIFITGFLGLTFLITSGCILYFRQMNESDETRSRFEILRKIGFTENDLFKGVRLKQIVNFGIPLVIGLLNSYFVVKSSWFIFGKEMWTPMFIVMAVYTTLYSIFAILSIQYDYKVIRKSL